MLRGERGEQAARSPARWPACGTTSSRQTALCSALNTTRPPSSTSQRTAVDACRHSTLARCRAHLTRRRCTIFGAGDLGSNRLAPGIVLDVIQPPPLTPSCIRAVSALSARSRAWSSAMSRRWDNVTRVQAVAFYMHPCQGARKRKVPGVPSQSQEATKSLDARTCRANMLPSLSHPISLSDFHASILSLVDSSESHEITCLSQCSRASFLGLPLWFVAIISNLLPIGTHFIAKPY
ncbi:hypothetical protein BD626DRAFT_491973 [Schizophyllum amplum]|uniref:Uncharacterized protein n=1 Tax=Schizophyllum amplum TaxID=97359 RepID=A0A550CI73_9AGAR|nr:hypothetical protein BD626DRAFT_491973 [Auriculariopsis ampla]